MANQKLETLLNLALETEEEMRVRSNQLDVGFMPEGKIWELIVKYHGDIERLQSDVIQVERLIAGYAVVRIPENLIEGFTALEEVEYVEKPKRLYFSTLAGKEASCIYPAGSGAGALTGEGVLIAVIDSGIDYQSPEFRDAQGNTRIRFLWDQTLIPEQVDAQLPERYREEAGVAAPPDGFVTGVEFDSQRINLALANGEPEKIVPSRDTSGHGTAVAAIAAAGGRLLSGQYRGVAPQSGLLVVKLGNPLPDSFPKTTELMRALTYAVKKAQEMGMPLAINLSFGNTYGSHDGTSLVERFLDNVAEIGRTVICVGSGNEGAAAGHVADSFRTALIGGSQRVFGGENNSGGIARVELSVGSYQAAFGVQLWKEYTDTFAVAVTSPGGSRVQLEPGLTGARRYRLENTELLVYLGQPSPYSVRQEFYFDFIPDSSYVNQGVWIFELLPERIVTGNFDFYLPGNTVLSSGTRFFTPAPEKTLTIPSTAGKVITVGAYDPVYESYADFSGRGYPLKGIAGDRLAVGEVKPDIAAPGVTVNTIGPDGTFRQVSGTSFATPFVTGSAALLMEWGIVQGNDPFLYGEKVKAYLRRGAKEIRGEREYPNERVGFGALCVERSLLG